MSKIIDSMNNEHIKAFIERRTVQRPSERDTEASRRGRLLESELEKPLPADVPLHKRGFGVMDDVP